MVGANRLWEVSGQKDGRRSEVRAELGDLAVNGGLDLTGWIEEAAEHQVPPSTGTPVSYLPNDSCPIEVFYFNNSGLKIKEDIVNVANKVPNIFHIRHVEFKPELFQCFTCKSLKVCTPSYKDS